jgi:hypothetical protein
VPLFATEAGAVVVFVAVGVAVAVAVFVAVGVAVAVADAVAVALAVALAVAVPAVVAFFVATGFELFVVVGVDEAGAEVLIPVEPIAAPPAMLRSLELI